MTVTAEELRALALRENRLADKARGQEVENVAIESLHRGKAHAYGHIAYLLEQFSEDCHRTEIDLEDTGARLARVERELAELKEVSP